MARLKIITNRDFLHQRSKTVTYFDSSLHRLLDDMHETLDAANGVGLAAVQVGVLWRVALVKEIYNGEERTVELINPEIITQSMPREGNEMCLSVPDECHILTRPHRVTVRAFDRNGGQFIVKLKNLSAVCACHEIDHLDGILYIDRVGK